MDISWYGTASICISHEGHKLLFDPFVSMNKALRYISAPELAQMGDIFITHGHFDHIVNVPEVLALANSKVHCSVETVPQLIKAGASAEQIVTISPGDIIGNGPFVIRVLKGEHIKNDLKLVIKTLINPRIISHYQELVNIIRTHKKCPLGQVFIYEISWEDTKVLNLGSLNLCVDEEYPQDVNVLCLPFQGRSDLLTYSVPFIERIKPRSVFLHHFDNSFPPLSSQIDCTPFSELIRQSYPNLAVIVPEYGVRYPIT